MALRSVCPRSRLPKAQAQICLGAASTMTAAVEHCKSLVFSLRPGLKLDPISSCKPSSVHPPVSYKIPSPLSSSTCVLTCTPLHTFVIRQIRGQAPICSNTITNPKFPASYTQPNATSAVQLSVYLSDDISADPGRLLLRLACRFSDPL